MSDEKNIHIENFFGSMFGNTTINVTNNYDAPAIPATEEAAVDVTEGITFEEAIPEYFRDATMMKAWNGLKDAGYLDGSYRCLEKCSRSIAKYIIWCFSDKMGKRYGKKKTEWAPFENFWGKSNLKGDKNECPKADEEIISKIFREL